MQSFQAVQASVAAGPFGAWDERVENGGPKQQVILISKWSKRMREQDAAKYLGVQSAWSGGATNGTIN